MKVAELLESRRENWRSLELLCNQLERSQMRKLKGETVSRFASLYRSTCADLALADAYQLPPGTVHYLHQLVGRAHNQLYRSRTFNFPAWKREFFHELPRRLFHDRSLWLAFALFWGIFFASLFLAFGSPAFTRQVVPEELLTQVEESFSVPIEGRSADASSAMIGFYIFHNETIGLQCFVGGLLLGVVGIFITASNAVQLGAIFGYLLTTPSRQNFLHFVTAHGPFELTAIVLSAAAGLRLGFSLVDTGGLSRGDSLRQAGQQAMPTMAGAIVLFGLAALLEAFLSPSSAPYPIKAAVAIASALMLVVYVFVLGYPRRGARAD